MELPSAIYAATGAIVAAIIAGIFSFLNLVSAKENKVSEFRLAWIDGLRDEIAAYTASVQHLATVRRRIAKLKKEQLSEKSEEEREHDWIKINRDDYLNIVANLSKIQLRLNPKHVKDRPESPEAILMNSIVAARESFNRGEHDKAVQHCNSIREAAAPLLKSTWDTVKNGEDRYNRIRVTAQNAVAAGIIFLVIIALIVFVSAISRASH